MSKFGFVYILVNEYMPDVYKLGCTERSPHERAQELSASTGIPAPFDVFCYIECADFQTVERQMHKWLADFRISSNREFFEGTLEYAVRLLYWHRGRVSFVATDSVNGDDHLAKLAELWGSDGAFFSMRDTQDPFNVPPAKADSQGESNVIAIADAKPASLDSEAA